MLVLISGVLQPKPNEAPEAAAHTEFGLGIKSRMVGESTEMMVMEYDIFFMFYTTILSVLCYMNTYLATWVVASAYGMFECILLAEVALQITLHVPDAREDVFLHTCTCGCKIPKDKSPAR